MRNLPLSMSLLVAMGAFGLSACGGGGSSAVASIPPPPSDPPPASVQTILSGVTTSQLFMSKGATYPVSQSSTNHGIALPSPQLGDGDQLEIRFDPSSKTYEIQLPQTQAWLPIALPPNTTVGGDGSYWETSDGSVTVRASSGAYAALVLWSGPTSFGATAVASPTMASAIPRTGSARYLGNIVGYTSEKFPLILGTNLADGIGTIGGTISLNFDFGKGTLDGSLSANVTGSRGDIVFDLPTLNFKDTIFGVGSTTFSGEFDTTVPGLNSFSGLFAGPTGSDVAGNFAFPYLSPRSGTAQQAAGAFIAHQ